LNKYYQKFLSHEKCGISNTEPKSWITHIVLKDKNTTDIKCIANFITEEWLISTASCLRNYKNASYYKIQLPKNRMPIRPNEPLEIEKVMDLNFYHNFIKLIIL